MKHASKHLDADSIFVDKSSTSPADIRRNNDECASESDSAHTTSSKRNDISDKTEFALESDDETLNSAKQTPRRKSVKEKSKKEKRRKSAKSSKESHDSKSSISHISRNDSTSKAGEAIEVDPSTYPYGAEAMIEINTGTQPTTSHQQFRENPRVLYPNGDSLSRPLQIPDKSRYIVVLLILAACLVAGALLYFYFDTTINEPKREQVQIQEVLSRPVTLNLPDLLSFVDMDDASIAAKLAESNSTLFERKPLGSGMEYDVIKLPDGMTLEDAAALYAIGIDNISAVSAAELFNGSWDLNIDRREGLNMSLHYVDFNSQTLEIAITSAIQAEGLDRSESMDSGEDDGYGNAYSTGSIMIAGKSYIWTVSAIPLQEVYSIAGLPESSIYVGIRIKQAVSA